MSSPPRPGSRGQGLQGLQLRCWRLRVSRIAGDTEEDAVRVLNPHAEPFDSSHDTLSSFAQTHLYKNPFAARWGRSHSRGCHQVWKKVTIRRERVVPQKREESTTPRRNVLDFCPCATQPLSPRSTRSATGQVSARVLKDIDWNSSPARLKCSHRKQKCPNQFDSGIFCGADGGLTEP